MIPNTGKNRESTGSHRLPAIQGQKQPCQNFDPQQDKARDGDGEESEVTNNQRQIRASLDERIGKEGETWKGVGW